MSKTHTVIDPETQHNIDSWLQGSYDTATKEEIRRLQKENPEELINAFYKRLSFGTGGLRGIMGVGTNRMNLYTIQTATQGLANYLKKQPLEGKKNHSVLIGFDCRHHSHEFAIETARVLAANGIEVYLYKELRPVALVSFGVLHLKCSAGVMITASHNPPIYNGYKVYWKHGGQVLPPEDLGIINEVNQIKDASEVKLVPFPHSLIKEVDKEIDEPYLKVLRSYPFHPGDDLSHGKDLHVVYSSLHGGGITMVPPALKEWGFTNLTIVKEQATPDGSFPTVKSPNPEDPSALTMGIQKMKEVKGDIFIATDPDCDRLALVVMHQGEPKSFNGNQAACLALEYIFQSLKETHLFPAKPMAVKTIVTTELFRVIAEHHNINCLDVLPGFKYIGEKISQWEEEGKKQNSSVPSHHFIFGGEESYGYLLGTHARDKDAVVSSALFCEMALHLKRQGKTCQDFLFSLYQRYGVYREKVISLSFEGKEGAEAMNRLMQALRQHPFKTLDGATVDAIEDYLTRQKLWIASGHQEPLLLPQSDVLRYWLSDETKLIVRPSGTEPKIKIYCECVRRHPYKTTQEIEKGIQECDLKVETYLGLIKSHLDKIS